jgi:hypothetical protein
LALALYFVRVLWMVVNHPLTLDGRPLLHRASCETPCTHGHMCACTHYLVFKEPECPADRIRPCRIPTERPFPSVLGEPFEVTTRCPGCQAPNRLVTAWDG